MITKNNNYNTYNTTYHIKEKDSNKRKLCNCSWFSQQDENKTTEESRPLLFATPQKVTMERRQPTLPINIPSSENKSSSWGQFVFLDSNSAPGSDS